MHIRHSWHAHAGVLLSLLTGATVSGASALQELDGQTFVARDCDHPDGVMPTVLRIAHGQLEFLLDADDARGLVQGPVTAHRHGHAVQLSADVPGAGQTCHVDAQVTDGRIEVYVSAPGRPSEHARGARVLPHREIPDTLAQAHALLLAHKPKQAIPLLQLVLDTDRFDVPDTAPALVEMVNCYQLLASDRTSAKAFASFSSTWLSQPLPLDGHTTLPLEQAQTDLLWHGHPGADGKPRPLVAFTVDSVQQSTTTDGGSGAAQPQLQIRLTGSLPPGIRLHVPELNSTTLSHAFSARAPGHGALAPTWVSVFDTGGSLSCSLSFPNPPSDIHAFDRLTGHIACTEDIAWKIVTVPLVQGSSWEEPGAHARLSSVTNHDSIWQVTIERTSTDPRDRSGGGSSSASSSSVSHGGRHLHQSGDARAPYWMLDPAGERSYPYGRGEASAGGTTRISLTMDAWGDDKDRTPTQMQVRVVTATAPGSLPVDLKAIELP